MITMAIVFATVFVCVGYILGGEVFFFPVRGMGEHQGPTRGTRQQV